MNANVWQVNTPRVESFIMEVQRRANIFPTASPHVALQDIDIEGYFVPKDTVVLPFIQGSLLNGQDFPDPMTFNPDRFVDSNGKFAPSQKVPLNRL